MGIGMISHDMALSYDFFKDFWISFDVLANTEEDGLKLVFLQDLKYFERVGVRAVVKTKCDSISWNVRIMIIGFDKEIRPYVRRKDQDKDHIQGDHQETNPYRQYSPKPQE